VKLAVRLGACIPEKPFNPEALAFPNGGKSKPMPVIVEVEPGCVICEVFVIVKVKVLVMELNSQTTVAVEYWPESTPEIVIVSARVTDAAIVRTATDAMEKSNLRILGIKSPVCSPRIFGHPSRPQIEHARRPCNRQACRAITGLHD
jgi:hypothetical protein